MARRLLASVTLAIVAAGVAGSAPVRASAPQQPAAAVEPQAVIQKYCVTCHSDRSKTGGLSLQGLSPDQPATHAETWEKVVKKLLSGMMPPTGAPRPEPAALDALRHRIEASLDNAASRSPNAGRPAVHRLNRAEYTNAIRDLLALEIDGKTLLPADNSGHGFDNVADVLTVSPGLLERYLLAAKKIARLAIGDASTRPGTSSYDIPYMTLVQDDRMSEDLPFGSRGGVAIRHYFPVDGEYEVKLRVQRNSLNIGNEIRGLDVNNLIDVRLDRRLVRTFSIGGRKYGAFSYTETEDIADAGLVARFRATAGMHVVGISFNRDDWYMEGVGMSRLPPGSDGYASGRRSETIYGRIDMGLDRVDVTGPFEGTGAPQSPSRRRLFTCAPKTTADEEPCARSVLSAFGKRAYRRPLAAAEVNGVMEFFRAGRAAAGTFDGGIERALVRVLTDPNFLFRVERQPARVAKATNYRISDLELASRLSFFLWSSVPDDRLLALAAEGRLGQPGVLDGEVARMIADPKSSALVSNFFGQWLMTRNMATHRPDAKLFPDFDENLREAFLQETQMFLDSQIRDDRPVTDLISADYTFVNERLARHYGIRGVYGSHFRRVALPQPLQRAGILGHGSVLTVTSYADRTSVVLRGKFILENILGTPPPVPPADVPSLENTKVEGTLRQRMETHRRNPVCANCHAQLDPMGFALENFNAIGRWRAEDGKATIDASGALPNGTKFSGPAGFRGALLQNREAFLTTLAEKLLVYALGRGLEPYDMPVVRQILRDTEAGSNRWSVLILNIAKSMPFQMRAAERH